MTARALVGVREIGTVPAGGTLSIGRDTFAARVLRGFAVFSVHGEELRRFDARSGGFALGPDGAWIAIADTRGLSKIDVASGDVIASTPTRSRDPHSLVYDSGFLYTKDLVWRANNLEMASVAQVNVPSPSHRVKSVTPRFAVSHFANGIVLWDRLLDRSVFAHELYNAFLGGILEARLALVLGNNRMRAVDLATNASAGEIPFQPARPDIVFAANHRYALVGYGTSYLLRIYELEWGAALPPADLEAVWSERAPIVDSMPSTREPDLDRRIARNHPRLEAAYASLLPAPDAMRWLRRALGDPTVATRPEVWARLAEAALACGDHDAAADACAEGLGRDEHDEALHRLLGRARQPRVE